MKRTLSILLALMMLLSSASFAAPTMVSSVATTQENNAQEVFLPEEAELTADKVDFVDEKYGNLVFNLDFETDTKFDCFPSNSN